MLSNKVLGEVQLLVGASFFGVQYVFQKQAMDLGISPLTFNALRTIGSAIFAYFARTWLQGYIKSDIAQFDLVEDENKHVSSLVERVRKFDPFSLELGQFELYWWGFLMGLFNCIPGALQQVSIVHVDATTTAFITSLYVIVTPIFEHFIPGMGYSLNWKTWIAAGISVVGMYFLSGFGSGESISSEVLWGESLILLSVLFYSIDIVVSDVASKRVDCLELSVTCFVVSSCFAILLAVVFESHQWLSWPLFSEVNSFGAWMSVILTSLCESVAITSATLGQMHVSPSRAALLYSLDVLFTAIFAFLVLSEILTSLQLFGCALVFIATFLSSTSNVTDEEDVEEEDDGTLVTKESQEEAIPPSKKSPRRFQDAHHRNVIFSRPRSRSFTSLIREERMIARRKNEMQGAKAGISLLSTSVPSESSGMLENFYLKLHPQDDIDIEMTETTNLQPFQYRQYSQYSERGSI